MSEDKLPNCPECKSEFAYSTGGSLLMCPECGHEWNPEDAKEGELIAKDINGNILVDGDSVTITKNLPVKGHLLPIKKGTKVKNIRIVNDYHNLICKVKDFGDMHLKSTYVKKS